MPRTKGSKNKNINTAKNKNIININVNSSKSKRGRGRPKKQSNDTTQNRQLGSGGMAPPQVIISQPQPTQQQDNSLLSSFITSKLLNESMNLNRSNMTNVEQPTTREQPSYFNARESIIPKLPDTPLKQEMKEEIKPPIQTGPPPPPAPPKPPPPPKLPSPPKGLDLSGLSGRDAMLAELKYAQTDEGKAEKARKKAEAAAKREAKKLEKETAPQQSTAEFLNMTFTPPKRDIVEMMTPSKEGKSTAITPYKGQQSTLEFLMGGTPQKTKPTQEDIKKARLTELKKKEKINAKELFELNDLKSHFTAQPNPNKDIARSIIGESIKRKAAEKVIPIKREESIKQQKQRDEASNRIRAAMQTKLTKQFKEAKKELRPQNAGQPLVVKQNTKELILKKNRDRGIKAQQAAASKKRSLEQEKIINFAKFMLEQK